MLNDPFDWYAPLPDLTAAIKAGADRYWAKQPGWKRKLRPLIERWDRSALAPMIRHAWTRTSPQYRAPPRRLPNWCCTLDNETEA